MKDSVNSVLKSRQQLAYLVIIILSVYFSGDAISQNVNKPSRQSSIEAFSDGKYEEAYRQFTELLRIYPKDPIYKYYSGACLVHLKRNPESATLLLQEALKGAAAVRSLPSDALFFLGRSQQMAGKFSEAVDSYRKYEEQAGRKVSRDMGVSEFIQQCLNRQGQIIESVAEAKSVADPPAAVVTQKDQPDVDEANAKAVTVYTPPPVKTPDPIKVPLTSGYEKILNEALDLQHKADSLKGLASSIKQNTGNIPSGNAEAYRKRILQVESLAASYQKQADQKFNDAAMVKAGRNVTVASAREKEVAEIPRDTIIQAAKAVQLQQKGIYTVFEVMQKPSFRSDEKIAVDPDVPEGLVYRIQMAVFKNPVAPTVFKGITPVYGFRITANGLTHYYAGMFRRSADASMALVAVKSKGFKDSFIVPFSGKKPISAERAASLEREWSNRPLFQVTDNDKAVTDTDTDTLPPTLIFRVEVARSKKPFDEKKEDELRKVAGNRGLDILNTEDESTVYLIGKFITFESAAEYNDILVRNGYRDSKVVALLGRREIPVETARKLFEKIE